MLPRTERCGHASDGNVVIVFIIAADCGVLWTRVHVSARSVNVIIAFSQFDYNGRARGRPDARMFARICAYCERSLSERRATTRTTVTEA